MQFFADKGVEAKKYTPDQQAVIELAKEAKKSGGASLDDTNILLDWAKEYNIPNHGPEIHPNRPGEASNVWHFHIGKTGHVPITGDVSSLIGVK